MFSFLKRFLKDFIYLFMRGTEREAETQAEGEAGCLWGVGCGTGSRGSKMFGREIGSRKL